MNDPIRVLLLEDLATDAKLVERELQASNMAYTLRWVDSRSAFLAAIDSFQPDIVLSDYSMPGYNGMRALLALRADHPYTPFIIVTGSLNEETAVECMKAGADDYVIKEHRHRLASAVVSAMEKRSAMRLRDQAEHDLRSTRDFLGKLLHHANGPIIVWDSGGTVVQCNRAFEELTGHPAGMVLGGNAGRFFPEIGGGGDPVKAIPEGRETAEEREIHCADGSVKTVLWNFASIHDDAGAIEATIAQGQDITERKRGEERLRQLSKAVEHSPSIIVITDRSGSILYVNPKFTDVTGYTADEVIGMNPRMLQSGETPRQQYDRMWGTLLAGHEWHGEFRNRRKDGTLYWETASISPIMDEAGGITHFVAVKEDSTAQKTLALEILRARTKAEQSDRVKSTLLENMSHEFRTPINGIMGLAALLHDEPDHPDRLAMLGRVVESGERLLNTLDAILMLAQLDSESMKVRAQNVDLRAVVRAAAVRHGERATAKGLTLTIADGGSWTVAGDAELLTDAFARLIDNAVKFTETGGVTIALVDDAKAGTAEVIITDTGCGIPAQDMQRIFEPFRQASEGLGRHYEGAGLGLTIVKRSLDLFHGGITIDAGPGGTCVHVTLPCVHRQAQGASSAAPPTAPAVDGMAFPDFRAIIGRTPRVLVVEDNDANAMLTRAILTRHCEVTIAETGEAAVELADRNEYDLVLMDINLGSGIDGIEATRRIRAHPQHRSTPIAALTGYTMRDDRERFLLHGLQHYLAKPFTRDQLLRLVRTMLMERAS